MDEYIYPIAFEKYSIEDIDAMIAKKLCTEEDIIHYFNNEWWRDQP